MNLQIPTEKQARANTQTCLFLGSFNPARAKHLNERNPCPHIINDSVGEEKVVGDKADCPENQNPQNNGKGRHGWPTHSQVLQTSDYLRKPKDTGNPSNEKHDTPD